MTLPKKPPYGISNFESLILENYAFVDKTRFIEQLEQETSKYHFLIRPRKFGKSLFLSMLYHYYDCCRANAFEKLFGELYIGKNPTPKRNSYFVMNFSFAGLYTGSQEKFENSFESSIKFSIIEYLRRNSIDNQHYIDSLATLDSLNGVKTFLNFAYKFAAEQDKKIFVIIDEYDHFANDLIALGSPLGEEQYKKTIWANSIVRDFYETLKDGTQTVIDKIFITGITPIMLDDITSGFNISNNLSINPKYNEILGFTKDEVELLIDQTGVDRTKIKVNIEFLYNGYLFHEDGANKVYNSSMILFFVYQVLEFGEKIRLIDSNLKTDYGRIKNLIKKEENILVLKNLIENKSIQAEVIDKFSIEKIQEEQNFLSLLYYMGLLTIEKGDKGNSLLKIPNYSIKTMYWEYIENIILENNPGISYNTIKMHESFYEMAFENEPYKFFEFINDCFLKNLSNRDLMNFNEKDLKILMLSILLQERYYLPISEMENSEGYSDIYLKRSHLFPNIKHEWVFELKYIKETESRKKKVIETKKQEAVLQLQKYTTSNYFKDRTDVRFIAVVFIGKKDFVSEEVL